MMSYAYPNTMGISMPEPEPFRSAMAMSSPGITDINGNTVTMNLIRRIVFSAVLIFLIAFAVATYAEDSSTEPVAGSVTVLITGANRGLGLEFARQYAERGYRVIATARRPESAKVLQALADKNDLVSIDRLDVTDFQQIDELADKYRGQPIDILLNNAGITGNPFETQVFGRIDFEAFDSIMRVNALAPLKMAEAFYDNVAASRQKKIIAVSSSMGSIAGTFGTGYFYRSSKSALNMMMANLAREKRKKGIVIGLVNPGAVATDMMAAMKGRMPLRDPVEATADMIRNIDNFTIETSGTFVEYDGSIIPW